VDGRGANRLCECLISDQYSPSLPSLDAVDFLHLPRSRRHPPSAHRVAEVQCGGEFNRTLHFLPWRLPRSLYPKLGKEGGREGGRE